MSHSIHISSMNNGMDDDGNIFSWIVVNAYVWAIDVYYIYTHCCQTINKLSIYISLKWKWEMEWAVSNNWSRGKIYAWLASKARKSFVKDTFGKYTWIMREVKSITKQLRHYLKIVWTLFSPPFTQELRYSCDNKIT